MKGWKTKVGVVTGVIGAALLAGSPIAPTPDMTLWLKFVGTMLTAIGSGLGVYGVAHKIEKASKN